MPFIYEIVRILKTYIKKHEMKINYCLFPELCLYLMVTPLLNFSVCVRCPVYQCSCRRCHHCFYDVSDPMFLLPIFGEWICILSCQSELLQWQLLVLLLKVCGSRATDEICIKSWLSVSVSDFSCQYWCFKFF